MQLKRLFFTTIILCSCTDTNEPTIKSFTSRIKNESGSKVELGGYDNSNVLVFQQTISEDTFSSSCEGIAEIFNGYSCGDTDSIVVEFDNSRGYICDLRQNGNKLCFDNQRNILTQFGFVKVEDIYEFIVSQEDFENANELPE